MNTLGKRKFDRYKMSENYSTSIISVKEDILSKIVDISAWGALIEIEEQKVTIPLHWDIHLLYKQEIDNWEIIELSNNATIVRACMKDVNTIILWMKFDNTLNNEQLKKLKKVSGTIKHNWWIVYLEWNISKDMIKLLFQELSKWYKKIDISNITNINTWCLSLLSLAKDKWSEIIYSKNINNNIIELLKMWKIN